MVTVKLPETVQVGGLVYSVVVESEALMSAERLRGETDHQKQLIRIRGGMADDITQRVLLHEILHTLFFAGGDTLSYEKEEKLVRMLQIPLFRFLRENDLTWLMMPQNEGKVS